MFKELHPLIQNRPLTITVASVGGGKVRVNVVPQALESDTKANEKIGHSHRDKIAPIPEKAIAALTTPLSITGTPDEIDAELAGALTQFAESHVQLQKTIEDAKEQIATAVKEIQERDKKPKGATSNTAKPEEKKDKPGTGELLPLWCKPQESSGTDPVAKSAAAEQPATEQVEVKS